jgi:FkbM family methyltransferase
MAHPFNRRQSAHRASRLLSAFKVCRRRTFCLKDCLRLFYLAEIKPSLVFRGVAHHAPRETHVFRIKLSEGKACHLHVRDNGLDVCTFFEFFSPDTIVFPPGLSAFQPKTIYDIGANIGISSLYFSDVFPQAAVYAFEPVPENLEVCRSNFENLKEGKIFPWAVGSRTGVASFECNNDPRGGKLEGIAANEHLRTERRIEVEVFSIDDLVSVQKMEPPDFLKIDVEGAEVEVLKGLERHLHTVKRIFVETHGPELKAACLEWMRDHSFKILDSRDETAIWGDRI